MTRQRCLLAILLLGLISLASATDAELWGSGTSPLVSVKKIDNPESGREFYRGAITVSGKWFVFDERQIFPDAAFQLCFQVSAKDQSLIPRPKLDSRSAGFCLNNPDKLVERFGVSRAMLLALAAYEICGISGEARITVDNYTRYAGQSEDGDHADLLKIHTQTPPSITPATEQQRNGESC